MRPSLRCRSTARCCATQAPSSMPPWTACRRRVRPPACSTRGILCGERRCVGAVPEAMDKAPPLVPNYDPATLEQNLVVKVAAFEQQYTSELERGQQSYQVRDGARGSALGRFSCKRLRGGVSVVQRISDALLVRARIWRSRTATPPRATPRCRPYGGMYTVVWGDVYCSRDAGHTVNLCSSRAFHFGSLQKINRAAVI
jgi:hypothetical protein